MLIFEVLFLKIESPFGETSSDLVLLLSALDCFTSGTSGSFGFFNLPNKFLPILEYNILNFQYLKESLLVGAL